MQWPIYPRNLFQLFSAKPTESLRRWLSSEEGLLRFWQTALVYVEVFRLLQTEGRDGECKEWLAPMVHPWKARDPELPETWRQVSASWLPGNRLQGSKYLPPPGQHTIVGGTQALESDLVSTPTLPCLRDPWLCPPHSLLTKLSRALSRIMALQSHKLPLQCLLSLCVCI